ncbi:allatostatin-A receptor-like [Actinia tenebrosa]|uniref:Allatostatin-A receptor-like n=1 Tax=Actinia tenebrosa TaxID=6105 RepID=A0A6P8J6N5_ACTTE|nr:allatostatin-A receptor-like [Actinia tenebrosa]
MDPSNTTYSSLARELANRSLMAVVLESTIAFLMLFLGFSGNVLVCLAVCRNPALRTSCNYLIVSLAITDVAMMLCCSPFSLVVVITGRMIFPDLLCQAQAYMILAFASISLVTLTQATIYRYLKVVHPARCFNIQTVRLVITLTWILFLFFPSVYFFSEKAMFYPGELYCFIRIEEMSKVLVLTATLIFSVIPLSIITFCYSMVFAKVRKHKQNTRKNIHASTRRPQASHFSPEEARVTMILVAVVIGFVICWTPVFCVRLLSFYKVSLPRKVHLMSTAFAAMSSCVNPFIYGVLNRDFKNEFKKILARFSCRSVVVAPACDQHP